jgi:beta-N-acetylhexosaminidase
MKHPGVIVAEDLEMKAVVERWGTGPAAVLAAKAGCDLLLVCATPDAQVEALEGLLRARERDEITWDQMDASGARIRGLKRRFTLPYADPDPRTARQSAGLGEHWALSREIAARGGVPV